jgi:hypothetical protein
VAGGGTNDITVLKFEFYIVLYYGYVAQLVERPEFTGQVAGSIPAISKKSSLL